VQPTPTIARRAALVALVVGLAPLVGSAAESAATADLTTPQGAVLGAVSLSPDPAGLRITGRLQGLQPGRHGLHLHAVGRCEGPDFASAGGHFNPAGRKHGLRSPDGFHAGDLPNLEVGPDGVGAIDAVARGAALDGGAAALLDADGSALVVHAGPDDELTDPAGNSGARVACGVVRMAPLAPTQLPRAGGWSVGLVASAALGLLGLGALTRRPTRPRP
jgi:Cu-Zn family superoxide dismutase